MLEVPSPLSIIDSCEGCGSCCLEQESPPGYILILGKVGRSAVNRDDPDVTRVESLPEALKRELLEYMEKMRAGLDHPNSGICLWFESKLASASTIS